MSRKQDKEFQLVVIGRDGRCMWPGGCGHSVSSFNNLQGHHGIARRIKKFRHDLRNGITLCLRHHNKAEANPAEWRMSPYRDGETWIEAGGWLQDGELVTPGMWRRKFFGNQLEGQEQ